MIEQFENKYSGERCFIIGNGPSIKRQDLTRLKDEYTFCTNWFVNHESFDELNINFYCTYDDAFVTPEPNEKWIEALRNKEIAKFFPNYWGGLELPFDDVNYVKLNKDVNVYDVNEFSVDPVNIGLYNADTIVINICIPLAVYMGFDAVYLIGCDSNYGISDKGSLQNAYFYSQDKHHTRISHNAETEKVWQNKIFKSYEIVNEYCKRNGIEIINATHGGMLEAFPREEYEQVVA